MHDFLLIPGGAEKLVDALASALEAPLVAAFANQVDDWISARRVRLRTLGPPLDGRLSRYLVSEWRFTHLPEALFAQDAMIYSGVIAPMAVHRQPGGRRIYYCQSPPRFVYDLREFYASKSGMAKRLALALFNAWLRPRYEKAVRAMDVVIANSENVRRRLKRYLGIESVVVHPPVDTERFRWLRQEEFYLSTARLEDFKGVNLIVEAFRRMPDQKLVVTSGGSQEIALRKLAIDCPNITFTPWLDESTLADLVGRSRAVIYVPRDEDFGISPVEAMAAGKPVIGVAEGGLLETVIDRETGLLLPAPLSADSLADAVRQMTAEFAWAMRRACEARAQAFSSRLFVAGMRAIAMPSTSDHRYGTKMREENGVAATLTSVDLEIKRQSEQP